MADPNRPLVKGDVCRVINGLAREKSPNLKLIVTVQHHVLGGLGMPHSTHGAVVRCVGEGVSQLSDGGAYIVTGWADFPAKWLERIEPDAPPLATLERLQEA